MSVLIDNRGRVYVETAHVNRFLAPLLVGRFALPSEANEFIKNNLKPQNADQLFRFIPSDMDKFCHEKGLIKTRASIFKKAAQVADQKRSDASEKPHINEGNEIHFIFAGSYIFYFNINNHHYSLIVQKGDWVYIPKDIEHWIKSTEDNYLVIASYHSEPFDIFHTKVNYTDTKSKTFI